MARRKRTGPVAGVVALFYQALLEPLGNLQGNVLLGQASKHFPQQDVGDFLDLVLGQLTEDDDLIQDG
jgi:hypothetical protein